VRACVGSERSALVYVDNCRRQAHRAAGEKISPFVWCLLACLLAHQYPDSVSRLQITTYDPNNGGRSRVTAQSVRAQQRNSHGVQRAAAKAEQTNKRFSLKAGTSHVGSGQSFPGITVNPSLPVVNPPPAINLTVFNALIAPFRNGKSMVLPANTLPGEVQYVFQVRSLEVASGGNLLFTNVSVDLARPPIVALFASGDIFPQQAKPIALDAGKSFDANLGSSAASAAATKELWYHFSCLHIVADPKLGSRKRAAFCNASDAQGTVTSRSPVLTLRPGFLRANNQYRFSVLVSTYNHS
jgi:hypothetical protein